MRGMRLTIQLAVGLTALGFLMIVLGWNGAASWDRVPSQLPYLISGGLAGLGLVFLGLVLVLVQESRRSTTALVERLDALSARLDGGSVGGPTALPDAGESVLATRTIFHRADCGLIEGRDDVQAMGPEQAQARGLVPCRICEPDAAAA